MVTITGMLRVQSPKQSAHNRLISPAGGNLMYAILVLVMTQGAPPIPIDDRPDLPLLSDLEQFPSLDDARLQVCRHQIHLDYLSRLMASMPGCTDDFVIWIQQTADRHALWDWLVTARQDANDLETRRIRLKWLKLQLGPTRYALGQMPEPFPPGLPRAESVKLPIPPPIMPKCTSGCNNR